MGGGFYRSFFFYSGLSRARKRCKGAFGGRLVSFKFHLFDYYLYLVNELPKQAPLKSTRDVDVVRENENLSIYLYVGLT